MKSAKDFAACALLASLSLLLMAPSHAQGVLKVMTQGLGAGTVQATAGSVINCGSVCDQTFLSSTSVTLQATAPAGSVFEKWWGDCVNAVGNTCTFAMSGNRSVRAQFRLDPDVPLIPSPDLNTPEGIQTYLTNNPSVTTAAQFIRALPEEYRKGWIMMSRSESLQTGTARFPRILLPSANGASVLSIGLAVHESYPGAHPSAIEFMQWDENPAQKTFRFHEIVLNPIPAMGRVNQFPPRTRGVSIDEQRCTRCHSTRNIRNPIPGDLGTTGSGTIDAKNKPNWDTYDSWGGMLPFNRDKIFPGSVEAAALRKLLNPWTWRNDVPSRQIIEQLELQSNLPSDTTTYPANDVFRRINGGTSDGSIQFAFDGGATVTSEPVPAGTPAGPVNYSFDGAPGAGAGSSVQRDSGTPVTLHAFATPLLEEGRAVQLFDLLGGADSHFNAIRIGNELASHRFATGGVPLDARPLALAIVDGCLVSDNAGNITPANGAGPLNASLAFFTARHGGMDLAALIADTATRAKDMPRRKADIEKLNLDRTGDNYLLTSSMTPDIDLLAEYGPFTDFGTTTGIERLRQEIFRRNTSGFPNDQSIMGGGFYVDREDYASNTNRVALFRYLLEPLGVSVDKWSMNVRGRSRAYTFADVFGTYALSMHNELHESLLLEPPPGGNISNFSCANIVALANDALTALPAASDIPRYTDVQRIFNKSCIECHGGLDYPPYAKFTSDPNIFNLSERENPPDHNRLTGSYDTLINNGLVGIDAASSYIFQRITSPSTACPNGAMPCGGPRLAQSDVETIRRWLDGSHPNTAGDPHIVTVDNVPYDFQSAGEFTLLRGEGMELQTRQTPIETDGPVPANAHTGLTSCPSLNTAVAMRIGGHRVTVEPDPSGENGGRGLQLRVDGKLVGFPGPRGILLPEGGRIMPTPAAGGIQVQYPGGTEVIVTPEFWNYYQVWFLNVDVHAARVKSGIMGSIAPQNWLPALPGGANFGPRPAALAKRFEQLYVKFTDAWRVTDKSSLFDYAAGKGTANYTLDGWPAFEPTDCKLPKGWSTGLVPPKRLSVEVAKRACANVIDPNRRLNCEADVALMGDTKVAAIYLTTEKVEGNLRPKPVTLGRPEAFATDVRDSVDFSWTGTTDKDGGKLTYMHCLWPQGARFTLKYCSDLGSEAQGTTASGLTPGTFYYWKVIVDDGQGATVQSETRRFQVQSK
jgi:hypothetical protein